MLVTSALQMLLSLTNKEREYKRERDFLKQEQMAIENSMKQPGVNYTNRFVTITAGQKATLYFVLLVDAMDSKQPVAELNDAWMKEVMTYTFVG